MLRYLQGLNWALLAIGATFTVVLSVVCLLLYVYLDTAPEYRAQFESVRTSTLLFAGVMLAAATAVWGHRSRSPVRWPSEALLVIVVVITVRFFLPK